MVDYYAIASHYEVGSVRTKTYCKMRKRTIAISKEWLDDVEISKGRRSLSIVNQSLQQQERFVRPQGDLVYDPLEPSLNSATILCPELRPSRSSCGTYASCG